MPTGRTRPGLRAMAAPSLITPAPGDGLSRLESALAEGETAQCVGDDSDGLVFDEGLQPTEHWRWAGTRN